MGGEDNLYIGIEQENHVYELLLPIDMQAHLRLVHKKDIMLVVLDEHSEQYGEHLLFATRKLVRHQHLTNLSKCNLVLSAYKPLACLSKEAVEHILEFLLWLGYPLCLYCGIRPAALQHLDDAVADVHLLVEILALQLVELPVELGDYRCIHNLVDRLAADERTVHTADKVIANPTGILGYYLQTYAL